MTPGIQPAAGAAAAAHRPRLPVAWRRPGPLANADDEDRASIQTAPGRRPRRRGCAGRQPPGHRSAGRQPLEHRSAGRWCAGRRRYCPGVARSLRLLLTETPPVVRRPRPLLRWSAAAGARAHPRRQPVVCVQYAPPRPSTGCLPQPPVGRRNAPRRPSVGRPMAPRRLPMSRPTALRRPASCPTAPCRPASCLNALCRPFAHPLRPAAATPLGERACCCATRTRPCGGPTPTTGWSLTRRTRSTRRVRPTLFHTPRPGRRSNAAGCTARPMAGHAPSGAVRLLSAHPLSGAAARRPGAAARC